MVQVFDSDLSGVHTVPGITYLPSAPGATSDASKGYIVGHMWFNTSVMPNLAYLCVSNAVGAAVWVQFASADPDVQALSSSASYFTDSLLDVNFVTGACWLGTSGNGLMVPISSVINSVTRSTVETTLLCTDPPGAPYSTFPANTPVIVPGRGLYSFTGTTNYLLNSTAPATQTTGTLATGAYVLWVNGTGTAAVTAGTATITGAGSATNGTPLVFSVTVSGTVTVTVTGTLNAFQLENGNCPSPLIVTTSSTVARTSDVIDVTSFAFGSPSALTMWAAGVPYAPINYGTTNTILQVDEGDNNSRMDLDRGATNGVMGSGLTISSVAYPTGNPAKSVLAEQFAYSSTSIGISENSIVSAYQGIESVAAAGPGVPIFAPSRIQLGCGANQNHPWNGLVQRAVIWPYLQPGATQQAITGSNPY